MRLSAVVLSLAILTGAAASCYNPCTFKFCTYKAAIFTIGSEPDNPFSSILCMHKTPLLRLGKVHRFGEPLLVDDKPVPISKWQPNGLQQRFDPNFFIPFSFANTPYSGVAHITVQRGQLPFLNNTCWALPVVAYNTIDANDTVVDNISDVSRPLVDCAALKTFIHSAAS